MKHLSCCVPATLSLILSFTPPGSLLADTGPFLANSEVTRNADLTPIDALPSSLSHRIEEQPQIILATGGIGGAVGRGLKNAGKAATKAPPPPPRPKSVGPPYKPIMAPPEKVPPAPVVYDRFIPKNALKYTSLAPQPRSTPRALKVAKGFAITTLIGGTLVGVGTGAYAGLIAGGLIEPIPGDQTFDGLRPQNNQ
jgi:hypothetical protein